MLGQDHNKLATDSFLTSSLVSLLVGAMLKHYDKVMDPSVRGWSMFVGFTLVVIVCDVWYRCMADSCMDESGHF
jgi:hypothetical protein